MSGRPWRQRLIALLRDGFPFSKKEREFYIRGAESMSEKDAKNTCENLEYALDNAPKAIAAAAKMLRERQKKQPL